MAEGPLNLYRGPEITLTRPPVLALSSVTELPKLFATQTWVPSEVTAAGNPPEDVHASQRCRGTDRKAGRRGQETGS